MSFYIYILALFFYCLAEAEARLQKLKADVCDFIISFHKNFTHIY